MKQKLIYLIVSGICLTSTLFWFLHHKKIEQLAVTKKIMVETNSTQNDSDLSDNHTTNTSRVKIQLKGTTAKKLSFAQLPGWNHAGFKNSLSAFQLSCKIFLKQEPTHAVGTQHIALQAKDWHPSCRAALAVNAFSEASARHFFEKWFLPIEFAQPKTARSLFTGYYMPQIKGSLTKTKKYNTPIYGLPKDAKWLASNLRNKTKRNKVYYTRAEIDGGVLDKKAPVIAWIESPVDRLFLEIEGSGVIELTDGKKLYLNYAGENGAPYTSIGSILIKKGIMTKDNASKGAIKHYLESHPQKANVLMQTNKSFVFFENLAKPVARGAQGMALTPGYSLAIDKKWIPLGAPLWVATKKPATANHNKTKKFQRLMIAQDTGGAIRGLMRADVYWGVGEKASQLGEHMKNQGCYWLLLPKHIFNRFTA